MKVSAYCTHMDYAINEVKLVTCGTLFEQDSSYALKKMASNNLSSIKHLDEKSG